jgi:hypothetical protein
VTKHAGNLSELADLARSLMKDRTAAEAAQLLAALRSEVAKQEGPPAFAAQCRPLGRSRMLPSRPRRREIGTVDGLSRVG